MGDEVVVEDAGRVRCLAILVLGGHKSGLIYGRWDMYAVAGAYSGAGWDTEGDPAPRIVHKEHDRFVKMMENLRNGWHAHSGQS